MMEAAEPQVPMTYDRGATALIQGLRHIGRALDEIRVAARIFGRSEEGSPSHVAPVLDWGALQDALETSTARLEEAEAVLREIWTGSRATEHSMVPEPSRVH